MKDKIDINRETWDAWTTIHEASSYYRLAAFKQGESALTPVVRDELGDVSGKSILHLQCHFGMETLSCARMGASVTGVDFSPKAVALATSLAAELGLQARFECADVFDAPEVIRETFDIVFVSYGSLPWIRDLQRWYTVVAHFLKPGGFFYLMEIHPFLNLLDQDGDTLKYPYFFSAEPRILEWQGSYAEPDADFQGISYFWSHSLSDVVTGAVKAGLTLDYFHEFPMVFQRCFPFLDEREHGTFARKGASFPHMFSVKASKHL